MHEMKFQANDETANERMNGTKSAKNGGKNVQKAAKKVNFNYSHCMCIPLMH